MQYNERSQSLGVTVVQAENLNKADLMGSAPDSYVLVYLLQGTHQVEDRYFFCFTFIWVSLFK